MRTLVILALLCLAAPAQAATIVVMTNSSGRDCYLATLQTASPDNDRAGIAACDQALEAARPDSHDYFAALVNRADIHVRAAHFDAAVADSDKAMAIDPADPNPYINRGAGKVGLERYRDAIQDLNRAIELGGEPIEVAYYNRALAKDYLGDVPGAYRDYKNAVAADPNFAPALNQLTRFQVKAR